MQKRLFTFLLVCLVVCAFMSSGCVSQSKYNELLTDVGSLQTQLSQFQNELSSTEITLEQTQSELSSTKAVLQQTQSELSSTKTTLLQTQDNLSTAQKSLSDTQKALADAQAQLNLYSDRLGITVFSEVQPDYVKIPGMQITLTNNPAAIDPSWQQLLTFIALDKTDNQKYIPNVFTCGGFAEMVHNNAERYGIKAALVVVKFEDNNVTPHV